MTAAFDMDRVREIARSAGDEPVTMVNMLRFRDRASYDPGCDATPCSGRDAYFERYASVSTPLVMAAGASIFWLGSVVGHVVSPAEERWDDILLVQYPNFGAVQRLFENPAYQAVVFHRSAALQDSRLIAARSIPIPAY
jgi:uncharacterized protein (DUF1330 family)